MSYQLKALRLEAADLFNRVVKNHSMTRKGGYMWLGWELERGSHNPVEIMKCSIAECKKIIKICKEALGDG